MQSLYIFGNMHKPSLPITVIAILFGLLQFFVSAIAQSDNNNITIVNKTQVFRFEKGKGDNPVVIKETNDVTYRCNEVRETITIVETYNNQVSIDDVAIYVSGKKNKYITPKDEYYSSEGIFYSDARVYFFDLPLEKKDATSQVKFSMTHKDPRYFTSVYFIESYLIENGTVTFIVPKWMKTELRELNIASEYIQKSSTYDGKEDADVITYTIKNLPARKFENYAPGPSYIYPHVMVLNKKAMVYDNTYTYFNTLADQYNWYSSLVQQINDDKTITDAKAKELTTGITDDLEKVKTIFNWVHRNIRYIAFEDGIAGFKPAKASEVLNKKYGDCKGMANLLKALLTPLGLDARLCWIGTNHIAYDYSTPNLAVDNHMICAWQYKGKMYFLDGTETNMAFNEYAERIQGRQVLIENGPTHLLQRIPTTTPEQNVQKEKIIYTIENNESLKGTSEQIYKGEARSDLLNKIQSIKTDNLNQALINYLSENNQSYQISNLTTTPLLGIDTALKIKYDVLFKNGVSAFGNEIYAELDFRKDYDDFTIDTAKRKHPLLLPFKSNIDQETHLSIPAGYKVTTLPTDLTLQHPNIDIQLSFKLSGNKLLYKKLIKVKQVMLKPSDFVQWNSIMEKLTEKYKEQIVLTK
jgi:hypothetical protein